MIRLPRAQAALFLLSSISMAVCGVSIAGDAVLLDEVTVTGTREAQPLAETAASVGLVTVSEIDELKAAHPSEVMGKVPGVYVNVTGGEGHMTAIRQPISTSPVYLYLEDGIPTRSTGFFNHNALYEINLPQAGGIEVSKGPGSALYGSDGIGGVINVLTRPSPLQAEAEVTAELGGHGWQRILVTGGDSEGDNGYRADLNLTHTDGWRDETEYDRQSATLRWDRFLANGAALKTVISGSNIDQQTAGTSRLKEDDYLNNPTINYTPVSFRKVEALRVSSAYEKETDETLLSITPYARYNSMEMVPNWSLSYDPQHYTTENKSLGLLSKYRQDIKPLRSRLIVGLDLDYSPGSRDENQLIMDPKVDDIYTGYTVGEKTYDYDVSYTGVSPYVHIESSPSDKLRLNVGLRMDYMAYDYDDNLSGPDVDDKHRRPESSKVEFDHLSPKLGATYGFTPSLNGFASYRNTFRAPSESQLFRQGQAESTIDLKPVDVDSFELGIRGKAGVSRYEVSVYHMIKKDDIVSYRNTIDGTRETMNAGKTLHRGVELGFGVPLAKMLSLELSYSYAKHSYEEWSPRSEVSYNGNEIKSAPRQIGDVRFNWRPSLLNGGRVELNWTHLGSYWLDDENTQKYDGHDLLHVRVNYMLGKQLELFGRIENLTDERYATGAAYSQFRGRELAPGLPRTLYAGLSYNWM